MYKKLNYIISIRRNKIRNQKWTNRYNKEDVVWASFGKWGFFPAKITSVTVKQVNVQFMADAKTYPIKAKDRICLITEKTEENVIAESRYPKELETALLEFHKLQK